MERTPLELAKLNRTLTGQLRSEARRRGVDVTLIRKQYIFTIFLRRVFADADDSPWTLLGGNALLIRAGGGRFTQDIDMARSEEWEGLEEVRSELERLVERSSETDPFHFDLYKIEAHSDTDPFGYGTMTAKVHVRANLDAVFEVFTIDLTTRRHLDGAVSSIPLRAIIDHPTLDDLPSVPTIPAENHLADKICALYEQHGPIGTTPSTRYRDLADAVRLIRVAVLDFERLSLVLRREEQRRRIELPDQMLSPGRAWIDGFPAAARTFAEYPSDFHALDAALASVQRCVGPVLAKESLAGAWDPDAQRWSPNR